MLVQVATSTISSFQAISVRVEVEAGEKTENQYFSIIGLADAAIREAKERVSSALIHSGFSFPKTVLVNLAPAELKKEGASFDLSIAVGVLAASKQLDFKILKDRLFFGELGLDGKLRSVKGIAALVISAINVGAKEIIIPKENVSEASLISGVRCVGVETLAELCAYLRGELIIESILEEEPQQKYQKQKKLMSEVVGQGIAKRALQIAAVGGHNILMSGPPGCGKSMLAERFPEILPSLSNEEILEVVKVYSVAGKDFKKFLTGVRPFRAPHYNISESGLIGGGSTPKPGEISLAHNGVLFLDEFPEYKRGAIESLRAPLENRKVLVSRVKDSTEFPAKFQLIAAMNNCPCGRTGVPGAQCLCSMGAINSYKRKISQPILDRIDMNVELDAVPINEIKVSYENQEVGDCMLKEKVEKAYKFSLKRNGKANASLGNSEVMSFVDKDPKIKNFSSKLLDKNLLSARGYFRMLKVARTIADLEFSEMINERHLAEAYSYKVVV